MGASLRALRSAPAGPRRALRVATLPASTLLASVLLASVLLAPVLAGTARAEAWSGRLADDARIAYQARTPTESWRGEAPAVLTRLRFDDDDLRQLTLEVRVETAAFDSGNWFRDQNARRVVFESGRYPEAVFRARALRLDGPTDLPPGARLEATIDGELELHGETREVAVPIVVRRSDGELRVDGSFDLSLDAFGMRAPSLFGVRVEDRVSVALDLRVLLEAP